MCDALGLTLQAVLEDVLLMDEEWLELLSVHDMFGSLLYEFQIWHTGLIRDKVRFADIMICDTRGPKQCLLEILQASRIVDEVGAGS
jgi:hypothetical protein